jgi:hypothetical protein
VEDPRHVMSRVLAVLEDMGVPCVVGGSYASSVHGFPRATNDIDLVADVRSEHLQPLFELLHGEFYVEPDAVAEAINLGTSFNLIHHATAFKIDVFVCGGDAFRKAQIARSKPQQVQGIRVNVLSPEDVVLAKLQWYRAGGEVSERQWRDVLEVILVQGDRLDLAYLRQEAEHMGLRGLLARAMNEARRESR